MIKLSQEDMHDCQSNIVRILKYKNKWKWRLESALHKYEQRLLVNAGKSRKTASA